MIRDVEYWQFEPEGQYLDRKSASKSPSELLRHLVAFANAEWGYLVVGIEDEKKNNIITGFKQPKAHKETYEKNYKKLQADLEQLDQQLTKLTKDKQGKTLYISHESMGYLAERYGFEQKGVQNMSAEDPSQKDLTNMVKAINKANVKYILYEDNVSTKVTDTIRKETDAKPVKFYNMESLNKQQEQDKR